VSDSLTVFCNHTTLVISARERDGITIPTRRAPNMYARHMNIVNIIIYGGREVLDVKWLIKLDLVKGFRKICYHIRYSICNKLWARLGPGPRAHLERLLLSSILYFIFFYLAYGPPLRPLRAPYKALLGKILFLSFFLLLFFLLFPWPFRIPLEP
jgi:hypothetical protein